jgi:hypothetical protein
MPQVVAFLPILFFHKSSVRDPDSSSASMGRFSFPTTGKDTEDVVAACSVGRRTRSMALASQNELGLGALYSVLITAKTEQKGSLLLRLNVIVKVLGFMVKSRKSSSVSLMCGKAHFMAAAKVAATPF